MTAITLTRSPAGVRLGWRTGLAAVGVVLTGWGLWSVVAWLAAGPYEVTAFRDNGSASYRVAKAYEVVLVGLGLVLGGVVIRGCLRARRFTFDAQLCAAGFLALWTDPLANFIQPVWSYSSNWVNLTNWCSQTPLVVNPDCGRMVEPMIFAGFVFTFGLFGAALAGGAAMRAIQRRHPDISRRRLLVVIGLFGIACDMILEIPLLALHLIGFLSFPSRLTLFGELRYPLPVMLSMGPFFSTLVALRNFKDDRGRTLFERGLDHLGPRPRIAVSFFALTGFLMLTVNALNLVVAIPSGFYADPKPGLPAHLINGMCDRSGFENTRYGPCPGAPGYRAPIRTLPGPPPPAGATAF